MPYRGDTFAKGRCFHVYNRALTGELLFHSADNYRHCLALTTKYAGRYGVTVLAYCLMPNHYHFLLRQETDQPLARFVQALFNAYVQALNRRFGRRGPLFEGRFRYACVDHDEYVQQLCRYIHLNPVKAGLVALPEDWPHSNYRGWIGLATVDVTVQEFVQEFWDGPGGYREFVAEGQEEVALKRYLLE